jgi:hypothetical protein
VNCGLYPADSRLARACGDPQPLLWDMGKSGQRPWPDSCLLRDMKTP